jgi:hypothetical protein
MKTPGLTPEEWLRMAQQSATARGLGDLEPLLAGLVPALRAVRHAHDTSTAAAPCSATTVDPPSTVKP